MFCIAQPPRRSNLLLRTRRMIGIHSWIFVVVLKGAYGSHGGTGGERAPKRPRGATFDEPTLYPSSTWRSLVKRGSFQRRGVENQERERTAGPRHSIPGPRIPPSLPLWGMTVGPDKVFPPPLPSAASSCISKDRGGLIRDILRLATPCLPARCGLGVYETGLTIFQPSARGVLPIP